LLSLFVSGHGSVGPDFSPGCEQREHKCRIIVFVILSEARGMPSASRRIWVSLAAGGWQLHWLLATGYWLLLEKINPHMHQREQPAHHRAFFFSLSICHPERSEGPAL